MECKEIRVDVRTASIKESTEGKEENINMIVYKEYY